MGKRGACLVPSCLMSASLHVTQQSAVNYGGEPHAAMRTFDPRGLQPQTHRRPSVFSGTNVSLPG